MKLTRLFSILLAFVLILLSLTGYAEESSHADSALKLFDHARGELSFQEWLDGPVTEAVGSGKDYYILALARTGHTLNTDVYVSALSNAIDKGEIKNPVSLQRCALTLLACNRKDLVPSGLADETIGKLGVMSYIFGLNLINNGVESELWTAETLVDKLIDMRKQDGGWAVVGNFSDVDVTCMALCALLATPEQEGLSEVYESAVKLLSERQQESGGFKSNGVENAESCAQVIIALSALGIDAAGDARFVKNGNSALDALLSYQLPDGGFSHLAGDAENETANIQALQAFIALASPGTSCFDLSAEPSVQIAENKLSNHPVWKIYAFAAIALFLLLGIIASLLRKQGRLKRILSVVILAGIAAIAVHLINVESTADYYNAAMVSGEHEAWISIRCDKVAGKADAEITPEDGVILPRTSIAFNEGDSVFDLLTSAARIHNLQIEYEGGTGDLAYLNAINHLYEYQFGELSGWIFELNGERLSIGSGACKVNPGDEIVWHYTIEMGNDIE